MSPSMFVQCNRIADETGELRMRSREKYDLKQWKLVK